MCSFSVVCPVSTFSTGASVQRMPAVSRPAWMLALSGFADRGGGPRRSPVEIAATMGTYLTRTQAAQVSGLRAGPFGRWADGVTAMREDCAAFARHWQAHNDEVLDSLGSREGRGGCPPRGQQNRCGWCSATRPHRAWAHNPDGGYVGQVLAELRCQTGLPWRVLNLSVSGSTSCTPTRPNCSPTCAR